MTSTANKTRDALAMLQIDRDQPRRPSPGSRLLRRLLVAAVVIGLGIGGWMLARRQGWGPSAIAQIVPEALRNFPEVRTEQVTVERGRSADAVVVATGYLESRRQAMIGARAAGRIESVNVEEGSRVREGEVMAVLEHKDLDAAIAAVQASVDQAKAQLAEQDVEIERTQAELGRVRQLREKNTTTASEFDQARFAYGAAVARRDSLAAALDLCHARVAEAVEARENMIIRAPFDGTVISKNAEVGESILPGGMGEASGRGSVVTIADLDHLEVDTDVKEDYINRVREGGPAEVAVDAVPDRRYEGQVRKVIPMGDRARATIKVKVAILNPDEHLFPDMSATVYFLPEQKQGNVPSEQSRVFCRTEAVRKDAAGTYVWVVGEENRVRRSAVEAAPSRDGRSEILEGLTGGEAVIVGDAQSVVPGTVVRIRDAL